MTRTLRGLLAATIISAAGALAFAGQQTINVGTSNNDGTGDPLRAAFTKVNTNFTDLYNLMTNMLTGTNVIAATTNPAGVPLTIVGSTNQGTNLVLFQLGTNPPVSGISSNGSFRSPPGSATSVAYGQHQNPSNGMYFPGTNAVALSVAGTNALLLTNNGSGPLVGIGKTNPATALDVNGTVNASNVISTNLQLLGNPSLFQAGLEWNNGILTSPQDPALGLWGHIGHGGAGNGLEWQWTFNQMYMGPINGGHVQYGLSTDSAGDALVMQYYWPFNTLNTNDNQSHAFGYHYVFNGGAGFWHTWISTPTNGVGWSNAWAIWHLSGYNGNVNQDWHTTGPDMLTMDGADRGFEVKGSYRAGLAISSGSASSLPVDYTNMQAQLYDLFQTTAFYDTNLNLFNHWTNNLIQWKDLYIRSPWGSVSVSFPTNWSWEGPTNTTAAAPTAIAGSNYLHLQLAVLFSLSSTNVIARVGGGTYAPATDPLAAAYFTAASITSTQQKNAYNQLALNLRAHGLIGTNKLFTLYPFSGVSAASDLIDFMGNHNGSAWHGTVTHATASGITGDGSTGYMDTGIIPTNVFASANSAGCFVWNRSTSPPNGSAFVEAEDSSPVTWMGLNVSGSQLGFDGPFTFLRANYTPISYAGFIAQNVNAGTGTAYYPNNTVSGSFTLSSMGQHQSFYILARNDQNTADFFSSANLSAVGFFQNMSTADMANLQSDITTWESAMGR